MTPQCRCIALLCIAFAVCSVMAQANISISGENSATYIYRTAKDSLNHYFEDELSFRIDQGIFTFGMTFLAELPKYNQFQAIEELNPSGSQLYTGWKERYIQLTYDDFKVKAGTVEETYGAGIVLRAWNDEDNYKDKRLEGAQVSYFSDLWEDAGIKVSGVYGMLPNEILDEQIYANDLIIGGDVELKPLEWVKIGSSMLQYKQKNQFADPIGSSFIHHEIMGSRLDLMFDMFDIKGEYAEKIETHAEYASNTALLKSPKGSAIYANANVYFDILSLNAGYKRYDQYNFAVSDMPTLNHYDELLSSFADNVKREEGFQGEVTHAPDMNSEITINYAESWNQSFSARHSNGFVTYKRDFNSVAATVEYEHVEKFDKTRKEWTKELRPSVLVDFTQLARPISVKAQWVYEETELVKETTIHHKPYLQIDSKVLDNLSVSISAEYPMDDFEDIAKNKVFIAGEIVTTISKHTDLKLFAGKEKGGKVCRNGTCQIQAPFEGVKLSLVSKF